MISTACHLSFLSRNSRVVYNDRNLKILRENDHKNEISPILGSERVNQSHHDFGGETGELA